ncbi:MAG: 2-succinyl-5-enolpyruvyl-6-hydroxy-3-cyclohexene-1-carboxylic-acid synthase [Synechococcales cyanobacterium T60_A2020_003]|nr:2-succinyl-5-enolpyruvyl-6-hydroxy-3-cyclohexene-1-carboxylic-acid synthase [Synechococcales cyanobacterium T60_A2020_003]
MPVQFSTPNSIWASVLVEVLARLGLRTAVLCPGSRSTPLTLAFAAHPNVEAIPVLDERSAAFFALGLAKRSGRATALVCTSGTAGANFYPAIIEAYESRVPLLVLTADRPPELRACNSGQTIDQQKLFGSVVNDYAEVAVPELDLGLLAYLRQTVVHAWGRSHDPVPGVVHLNLPFRDPLAPISMLEAEAFATQFPAHFFDAISEGLAPPTLSSFPSIPDAWYSAQRGIIIAGIAQPQNPEAYCGAIAALANHLKFPVLAEGLSPVRNFAQQIPDVITTYDWILRNPDCAADLAPDLVIRIGEMPTSKVLREWLTQAQPRQWVIDPGDRNLDPLHGFTVHLRGSVEHIAAAVSSLEPTPERVEYGDRWTSLNTQVTKEIQRVLSTTEDWIESKIPWLLSQVLPTDTPIFIANSMPIRDVEWFWPSGDRHIRPFANRGANGIDGTLSTALGIAHGQPYAVLLTGDLALLHDTNGFLLRSHLRGHLTIVLVNNDGGGIFEMLPISQFDPPFEEFFATPQSVDMAQLCRAYGVSHTLIQSWTQFQELLSEFPDSGIRVLEIRSDRKQNAAWRSALFRAISQNL